MEAYTGTGRWYLECPSLLLRRSAWEWVRITNRVQGPWGPLIITPQETNYDCCYRKEIQRSALSLQLSGMQARQWVPIDAHFSSYCKPTTYPATAGTKPSETRTKFTKGVQSRGRMRQEDDDRCVHDVRGAQGSYGSTEKKRLHQAKEESSWTRGGGDTGSYWRGDNKGPEVFTKMKTT